MWSPGNLGGKGQQVSAPEIANRQATLSLGMLLGRPQVPAGDAAREGRVGKLGDQLRASLAVILHRLLL